MKKAKYLKGSVKVSREQLKYMRDHLIDYANLVEAIRVDRRRSESDNLASLKYLEKVLIDQAERLTSWLKDWEQDSLPF